MKDEKKPEVVDILNYEPIALSDEILERFKLTIDETKIENFNDINFVSLQILE